MSGGTRRVRLRYSFGLYPTPGQRGALAKAFGCARVVVNDGLRARQKAHQAGLPGVPSGHCPVRAWQCGQCGTWLDREINAAVSVAKAAGLAVTACGARVRPGAMPLVPCGEPGTLPGAA